MSKQQLSKEELPPLNWDKDKVYFSPSGERVAICTGGFWQSYIREDATAVFIKEAALAVAKQEAIGFAEWLGANYDFNEFEQKWGKFWEDTETGNNGFDAIEISELYQMYIKKTI